MVSLTQHIHESTTDLVQRCRKGDQQAWNALIDRFGRLVSSIPRHYGFCQADTDDVFQIVFSRLCQSLDALQVPERLSAWLITTTHRECWRICRARHLQHEGLGEHADSDQAAPDLASQWEAQQLVREALQRLSKRDHELVRALFLEAPKPHYPTIARRLGMKLGSIGPTRMRCLKKLQKAINEIILDRRVRSRHQGARHFDILPPRGFVDAYCPHQGFAHDYPTAA